MLYNFGFKENNQEDIIYSLFNVRPEISVEWDYERNGNLTPDKISYKSKKGVWWKCSNGHAWQSTVIKRTEHYATCHICARKEEFESGYNDLETKYPEIAKEYDLEKNLRKDVSMIDPRTTKKVWWKCSKDNSHKWKQSVYERTHKHLGCPYCKRANEPVNRNYSLAALYPELMLEWDKSKNKSISPTKAKPTSKKKVSWICSKDNNHRWEATIYKRAIHGSGCPICINRKIVKGINDLATTNPQWLKEWDYERNKSLNPGITPYNIGSGSEVSIAWKCTKGHEGWFSTPAYRRKSGAGCPSCSNSKRTLKNKNSLQDRAVEIAKEWDYKSNYPDTPDTVAVQSTKEYWWKCSIHNKSWKASVVERTKRGHICPLCKEDSLRNSNFTATHPELLEEWDYAKNTSNPDKYLPNSSYKANWACSKGHKWEASIKRRTDGKGNCPYCNGTKLIPELNSLAAIYPDIAKNWDYEKNLGLSPTDVSPKSKKAVWWKCSVHGDRWKGQINTMIKKSTCPSCRKQIPPHNKVPVQIEESLLMTYPKLAKEWDYERNTLRPEDIKPGSGEKVHWICDKGHRWIAPVFSRKKGNGCPCCSGRLPIPGETDLATTHPHLINEWSIENKLKPTEVFSTSRRSVIWTCKEHNHSYEETVKSRVNGKGCPYCRQ